MHVQYIALQMQTGPHNAGMIAAASQPPRRKRRSSAATPPRRGRQPSRVKNPTVLRPALELERYVDKSPNQFTNTAPRAARDPGTPQVARALKAQLFNNHVPGWCPTSCENMYGTEDQVLRAPTTSASFASAAQDSAAHRPNQMTTTEGTPTPVVMAAVAVPAEHAQPDIEMGQLRSQLAWATAALAKSEAARARAERQRDRATAAAAAARNGGSISPPSRPDTDDDDDDVKAATGTRACEACHFLIRAFSVISIWTLVTVWICQPDRDEVPFFDEDGCDSAGEIILGIFFSLLFGVVGLVIGVVGTVFGLLLVCTLVMGLAAVVNACGIVCSGGRIGWNEGILKYFSSDLARTT